MHAKYNWDNTQNNIGIYMKSITNIILWFCKKLLIYQIHFPSIEPLSLSNYIFVLYTNLGRCLEWMLSCIIMIPDMSVFLSQGQDCLQTLRDHTVKCYGSWHWIHMQTVWQTSIPVIGGNTRINHLMFSLLSTTCQHKEISWGLLTCLGVYASPLS